MRMRALLSMVALLMLSVMSASCCAWCEPDDGDATTIELQHEHVATWMGITSKFAHVEESATDESAAEDEGDTAADAESGHGDYWTGVLFQLGTHDTVADGAYRVVIETETGTDTYLLATQRVWVNVVADATAEPMTHDDLGTLWPDPDTETICDAVDECAGDDCLCPSPPCESSSDLAEIPESCLRLRTLHRDFLVTGVLTYWNGDAGFSLDAKRGEDAHHLKEVFTLHDPVRVEVWELESGGSVIEEYDVGTVKSISIYEGGLVEHGTHESPPWPGFGT